MWQALGAAAGSLGGGILSHIGGQHSNRLAGQRAHQAMHVSSREAALNRDFQAKESRKQYMRQMHSSATSYQRAVNDLEAAGLNPLLALGGGAQSASGGAPAGSQGQGVAAQVENELEGMASSAQGAVQIGMQMKRLRQELKNMKEGEKNLKATRKQIESDTAKKSMETKVMSKDLPKADLINTIYDMAKPIVDKAKQTDAKMRKYIKENKFQKYKMKGMP